WTYVQDRFAYHEGPRTGYFRFTCSVTEDTCDDVIDTFGVFYVATSLLIAEKRWQDDAGVSPYGAPARQILDALHLKEVQNRGVVEGVLNVFGPSYLPRMVPLEEGKRNI